MTFDPKQALIGDCLHSFNSGGRTVDPYTARANKSGFEFILQEDNYL